MYSNRNELNSDSVKPVNCGHPYKQVTHPLYIIQPDFTSSYMNFSNFIVHSICACIYLCVVGHLFITAIVVTMIKCTSYLYSNAMQLLFHFPPPQPSARVLTRRMVSPPPEEKTAYRKCWELYHAISGFLTIAIIGLGLVSILMSIVLL